MGFTARVGALALLLVASVAQADTIEVTATTLLNIGRQTRGGVPGQDPDLASVAPAFEIVDVTARDVRNGVADDLTFQVSSWGSYDLGDRRWDNGTGRNLTGDLVTGYVQGKLWKRRLSLRLGRAQIQGGAARMLHLDGGELQLLLPAGLRLSAYAGSPVSQRFTTRAGVQSWNPMGGDLAYGGRLGWSYPLPGVAGRGLDVGVSANLVQDGSDPVRQEAGLDFRLRPSAALTLSGFGAYSLPDQRPSELTARATYEATRKLFLEADWRFVAPDLFLSRSSILSVFSDSERNSFGGGATYAVGGGFRVAGAYHLQLEPGETAGASDEIGHEGDARVEWERGRTLAGVEGFVLDAVENGYVGGRLFARQELGRLLAAADVMLHQFREDVNGESSAITGTVSLGYQIAAGFSAVLSGRAGTTPYFEQTFDLLAKLVYNQTYRKTEVR